MECWFYQRNVRASDQRLVSFLILPLRLSGIMLMFERGVYGRVRC